MKNIHIVTVKIITFLKRKIVDIFKIKRSTSFFNEKRFEVSLTSYLNDNNFFQDFKKSIYRSVSNFIFDTNYSRLFILRKDKCIFGSNSSTLGGV